VGTRAFRNLTGLQAVAILATTFAVVWGALLPYAAQAAARPGQAIVLCSVEGPQTIVVDPDTGKVKHDANAPHCPACVVPTTAVLPAAPEAPSPRVLVVASTPGPVRTERPRPPARAPPRPPSTAPPHA
jgi:hypothetical protein